MSLHLGSKACIAFVIEIIYKKVQSLNITHYHAKSACTFTHALYIVCIHNECNMTIACQVTQYAEKSRRSNENITTGTPDYKTRRTTMTHRDLLTARNRKTLKVTLPEGKILLEPPIVTYC